jgi:UDP-GlcNAc3NAcA epimerase
MKKIVTVLGARPQFIKASVVSDALARTSGVREVVVHTGQHFDANMSDVFFTELGMAQPAHQLDIHGGSHGEMTGRMLIEVEKVLLAEKPDVVLVYGDTNSTLAGALAAAKLHIPVAHVEAGLRSFNMRMPEEINRILTDRLSRWLFVPTDAAVGNLLHEGVPRGQIEQVGDVMYDVALHHGARVTPETGLLARLGLGGKRYLLATVHRAENTDDPVRLRAIANAMARVGETMPVVWPMHPRTTAILEGMGQLQRLRDVLTVLPPLGYLDMVQMEKYAALIVTDSGGVQKEAFFCGVPCVTLRDETEWVELVDAGWNRLVTPGNADDVAQAVLGALGSRGKDVRPYGDGKAAVAIAATLGAQA